MADPETRVQLTVREFMPDDAEFCFKVRSSAFILKFYDEIGPEAVAACVNAFMPDDYVRMATEMKLFIIETGGRPIGFFTIKTWDEKTAEIPLIYVDLNYLGRGVGSYCIRFIEKWLASEWRSIETLFLDTIIPEYNSGFYRKAGFVPSQETSCDYPTMSIKALRLSKNLKR